MLLFPRCSNIFLLLITAPVPLLPVSSNSCSSENQLVNAVVVVVMGGSPAEEVFLVPDIAVQHSEDFSQKVLSGGN